MSRNDPHSLPLFVRGRSLGGLGLEGAIALALSRPEIRIAVFEADWSSVDRSRMILAAQGLDARIAVHHRHAWPWIVAADRHAA